METISYELKYCERCGALCTRRSHSADSYCEPCAQMLVTVSLPVAPDRPVRSRRPWRRKLLPDRIEAFVSSAAGRVQ